MNEFDKKVRIFWSKVRKKREEVINYMLNSLIQAGFPADVISLGGLLFGLISTIFLGKNNAIFFFFWTLKRFADIIDGPIARANNVKLIWFLNVDIFCDLFFNIALFLAAIPLVGLFLPLTSLTFFLIHLIFDYREIGRNPFVGPSNIAPTLFFFGKIREGIILQIVFDLVTFSYNRIKKI